MLNEVLRLIKGDAFGPVAIGLLCLIAAIDHKL